MIEAQAIKRKIQQGLKLQTFEYQAILNTKLLKFGIRMVGFQIVQWIQKPTYRMVGFQIVQWIQKPTYRMV